ncbi:glutathione S-transferase 1-1-like isoform X2 [Cylas formicarius]|uniref:glutathione S-transferase 1-1-like isoform X2 n=1 Tax=Cylas formicarius TaxID=197179 RepID=UPI0029586A33|nr:glutathione S-transferase 1-1-like isoform X2 [Cylas formicarius]
MENGGVVPLTNSTSDRKMATHPIDIYYFPPSAPSRATLLLIKALGIDHNVKITNISQGDQMKPEFLQMNPLHTIPLINDNGFIIYESNAIMKYLVDQYGKDDSLSPKDPKKAAIVDMRLYFCACHLFPKFRQYYIPTMFQSKPPSSEALRELEEVLTIADGYLKDQPWFAGHQMTVADFAIVSFVATIDAAGGVDLAAYPEILQWYQRARSSMAGFGYDEVIRHGAAIFAEAYKNKLNSI